MSPSMDAVAPPTKSWVWPLDVTQYNREPMFSMMEQRDLLSFLDLEHFTQEAMLKTFTRMDHLERLVRPLRDVFAVIEGGKPTKTVQWGCCCEPVRVKSAYFGSGIMLHGYVC